MSYHKSLGAAEMTFSVEESEAGRKAWEAGNTRNLGKFVFATGAVVFVAAVLYKYVLKRRTP